MIQIRRGVFETNSSSTHSISIYSHDLMQNNMRIDEDGYIHAEFGEFGWEEEQYSDQWSRLSYLLTMAMHKEGFYFYYCKNYEDELATFLKTTSFNKINDAVSNYCNCKGIWIDKSEGYIDHQSHEDYSSLDDFLEEHSTNIAEFVFGNGTIIHTDNDNH